jgi:hypothetical protein
VRLLRVLGRHADVLYLGVLTSGCTALGVLLDQLARC